ncbi:MAG: hypothetical protein GKR97_09750 [Rhizobiaceae bacterium]|nr:hypothetical protein [Rhizobiaceae bacterium]
MSGSLSFEELNIRFADDLDCADYHSIAQRATKEIAWQQGRAATFLAKWEHNRVGSSSHVHQSLWADKGDSVFFDADADANAEHGLSEVMQHHVAGLISILIWTLQRCGSTVP